MNILAIDTSAVSVGAAIADEMGLVCQLELGAGRQASETLLPLLKSLLGLCKLALSDMDALAVTIGPGSFTGLRIGLATAKACAQALAKPLVAVSTLEALAYGAYEHGHLLCPILNARRGELYAALFAEKERLSEDMLTTPLKLVKLVENYSKPVIFCGDGLIEAGTQLADLLGNRMLKTQEQRQYFLAAATALLGRDKYLAGELADPIMLQPRYLRPSAAEENRQEALDA
ncbi:MAG: tRNA (adenosine(37)-N6)-threonylcarbamoyltransferase complex dimerization subunit type 1 TsaB [Clostridiales bacterium]|nr:tRNA (adenosine(37)-N6)-threonylcarbamoyltransferase complex dimerization subunit type 1 TsaB [Clostridiales bacterium]